MPASSSDNDIQTLTLVRLDAENAATDTQRPRHPLIRNRWYGFLLVLPTLLAGIYYWALAADRYQTEARFVVRSPSASAAGQLASFVQGSTITRSSDDAYIIHAYMQSRDATRSLALKTDLVAKLNRSGADVLWGYPMPLDRPSDEHLWAHFQRFLDLHYDKTTGITTLKVQAFRAEDAQAIAETLLADAEVLINRLSERSQAEAVRMATAEADRSRENARRALTALTEFRRTHAVIDPGRASASALETITRLALDIAKTNAELRELNRMSPDSPQANVLRHRVIAFDEQIQKERTALAGAHSSLADIIADYERLVLEREFAERTFASAQGALDLARIDAERQRLFLERISTPSRTDFPQYPYRGLGLLLVFAALNVLYVIGRYVTVDTRSHAGH